MRPHDPFDRKSLAASVGVHAGVLLLAVLGSASARPPLEFVSYQVEIVSPPPAAQADVVAPAQQELVVERPDPEPPQPEEQKAPVVEEKPKPKPAEPQPKARVEQPKEAAEEAKPATSTEKPAEEKPRESGEGINVRMEGLRRDFPVYYQNIITQINRCLRWRGAGNWATTVYFVIRRDGTVTDLDVVRRSGNATFDFEAMGAVECAGKGRFGPLPEDLPWEILPVQFEFKPPGREDAVLGAGPTLSAGKAAAR
ncbi:MAG: hypothetical protein AMXMBFR53_17260 [Gemmatimonadota bacterium]